MKVRIGRDIRHLFSHFIGKAPGPRMRKDWLKVHRYSEQSL